VNSNRAKASIALTIDAIAHERFWQLVGYPALFHFHGVTSFSGKQAQGTFRCASRQTRQRSWLQFWQAKQSLQGYLPLFAAVSGINTFPVTPGIVRHAMGHRPCLIISIISKG
jgi:hypothetical protein